MTANYLRAMRLSNETMDVWSRYDVASHVGASVEKRIEFYMSYLYDVVPDEVNPHLITNDLQPYNLQGMLSNVASGSQEIQLWYGDKVFMTGVVSDAYDPSPVEDVACGLASSHWGQRHTHRYHDHAWAAFTGLEMIRFCSSRDGQVWTRAETFHPINDVREVVAYFQREFENIRRD